MLGMVLIITVSSFEAIITLTRFAHPLQNGYHAQLIFDALASYAMILAISILCPLPFTTAFVDDIKKRLH